MADEEQTPEGEQEGASQDGTISVTVGSGEHKGAHVEFEKIFGANLTEAAELYGKDVVYSLYHRQAVISCQARVRSALSKGSTKEAAIEGGRSFVPGLHSRVPRVKVNPVESLAQQVIDKKLSMEELMEQVRARILELGGGQQ